MKKRIQAVYPTRGRYERHDLDLRLTRLYVRMKFVHHTCFRLASQMPMQDGRRPHVFAAVRSLVEAIDAIGDAKGIPKQL